MHHLNDESVLRSWNQNAQAWITTVENAEIASRKVTNRAIVDAIISYFPESILDIGCGEGWLTHELTTKGINATGIDGVPALITKACMGDGKFLVASYEDIATTGIDGYFDAAVCNFSLLGDVTVNNLIAAIPSFLKNDKFLFIQTLHPLISCGELPYTDGWRQENWNGFSSEFKEVAPWYFRKLETWVKLLHQQGFSILECREPIHPLTQEPVSIIFVTRITQPYF